MEADTVKEEISNWGLFDGIIGCCFGNTASNIVINRRGCILLQQLLNKQLLWLYCRQHIAELPWNMISNPFFGKASWDPLQDSQIFLEIPGPIWLPLASNSSLLPPCLDPLLVFFDKRLLPENISQEETPRNVLSRRWCVLVDMWRGRNPTPTSYHDLEQTAMLAGCKNTSVNPQILPAATSD